MSLETPIQLDNATKVLERDSIEWELFQVRLLLTGACKRCEYQTRRGKFDLECKGCTVRVYLKKLGEWDGLE